MNETGVGRVPLRAAVRLISLKQGGLQTVRSWAPDAGDSFVRFGQKPKDKEKPLISRRQALIALGGLAGLLMPLKAADLLTGVSNVTTVASQPVTPPTPTQAFYKLVDQYQNERYSLDQAKLDQYARQISAIDTTRLEKADQAYLMLFRNDVLWRRSQYGRDDSLERLGVKFEPAHKLISGGPRGFEQMIEKHNFRRPHPSVIQGGVGRERYEAALNYLGYVDLTADQLIRFARTEYDQLEARMDALARQADPDVNDWRELYAKLRLNHPRKEEVLDEYRKVAAEAKRFLEQRQLMSLPAEDPLTIAETPYFWRSQIPFAAYSPYDKTFMVTITTNDDPAQLEKQLQDHAYAGVAPIVVHEAYPGHHIQGMHQDEIDVKFDPGDPRSEGRKFLEDGVDWHTSYYKEGWGVYAEQLLIEEGFYDQDPAKKMIALRGLLWRAARAMIDPMVHTGQMSYEQAVDFMEHQVVMDRERAESEINRYYSRPIDVASYYLGMRQIHQLREQLKAQGVAFDLKTFHDRFLGRILPVPVMAKLLYGIDLKPLNVPPA